MTITEEHAKKVAQMRLDAFWDKGEYQLKEMFDSKEEAFQSLWTDMLGYGGGNGPMLHVVKDEEDVKRILDLAADLQLLQQAVR
jgi:hypothetical protein